MSASKKRKLDKGNMDYFNNAQFSDLTLVCGDKTYKVHKVMLCSKSTFFYNACAKELKPEPIEAPGEVLNEELIAESSNTSTEQLRNNTQAVNVRNDQMEAKVIVLEEDISALEAMLSFFYRQDYEYPNHLMTDRLRFDVTLNTLADKYEVPSLHAHICSKFSADNTCLNLYSHPDAVDLTKAIFASNNLAFQDLMIDNFIRKIDAYVLGTDIHINKPLQVLLKDSPEFARLLAERSFIELKVSRDKGNDLAVKLEKAEKLAEERERPPDEVTYTCKDCHNKFVAQTWEDDETVYCPYCGTKHRLFQRDENY